MLDIAIQESGEGEKEEEEEEGKGQGGGSYLAHGAKQYEKKHHPRSYALSPPIILL